MTQPQSLTPSRIPLCHAAVLALLITSACGGSNGLTGFNVQPVGSFQETDSGSFYFVDPHEGGTSTDMQIAELTWGRLVDVHALEADGSTTDDPILQDYVVRESLSSISGDYVLETDTVTSVTRLVIQRQLGASDTGNGTFEDLARAAAENLTPVLAKGDGPNVPGPFTFLARNATLVIQFSDILFDENPAELPQLLSLRVGSPPLTPFDARVLFDSNHGGLAQGDFHSSRVLVDMTVSLLEMERGATPVSQNAIGLPPSREGAIEASVSLRIPTRENFGAGQFEILRSTFGDGLDPQINGPVDLASPTRDVVRAMRAGNRDDLNNGFMRDDTDPELLGAWPLLVQVATPDPIGEPGKDFLANVTFQTACRRAFQAGDVLTLDSSFLEVRLPSLPPDSSGRIADVRVRLLGNRTAAGPELLGPATVATPFESTGSVALECWMTLLPSSIQIPGTQVSPGALIGLSFSEAMDPEGLGRDGGLRLVRGDANQEPSAIDNVVGRVVPSADAKNFTFVPRLPLDHVQGAAEPYTLRLETSQGEPVVTDLAGNPLGIVLPPLEFTLDPAAETLRSGGIALDFLATDEYDRNDPGEGTPDLRGQVSYDLVRGKLMPRRVIRQSWTVDGDAALPSLMFQLPVGIPEPLSPYGSKLQTLWRYADIGWNVTDESKYDLDVEGLAWRPFSGGVSTEFYENFRISLAHSSRLPDESLLQPGVLLYPQSGLLDNPMPFSANVLEDPASPQKVVHSPSLGYRVDPNMTFQAANGNNMMPFPLNRAGGPHETFTWRDTTVLATGGLGGGGIPLGLEGVVGPAAPPGSIAGPGAVPSYGLPLLMEFSCFPSDFGIGVNQFTLAVASLGQLMPNFRVHSTGGTNSSGTRQEIIPDSNLVPQGGYDPTSTPPGMQTRSADPTIYFGQLDTVTRVSRVFTVWFDTESTDPNFFDPLVTPSPDEQPEGTRIEFAYRGARTFTATGGAELDASMLDAYGNISTGTIDFLDPTGSWSDSIDAIDGARYVQVRMSFLNNVESGQSPELEAFSIAYSR